MGIFVFQLLDMNPFYDISDQRKLPSDALQLNNLGTERVYASFGRNSRDGWGGRTTEWSRHMIAVQPEDYDRAFAHKLSKSKPIYFMTKVLDHHFEHYLSQYMDGQPDFLTHMRYIVLPAVKKINNSEVCVTLFEEWLQKKMTNSENLKPSIVNNNTINVGTINSPVQFQQNSDHSNQVQHNHQYRDQIKDFLEVLRLDIQTLDENIRKDFAMEMNYAVAQLDRDKNVQPQLTAIGGLMKDIGLGTFTNLLAAPIFEIVRPMLGL
ncbi:hypothetical protein D3C87_362890 [compost metagenome]